MAAAIGVRYNFSKSFFNPKTIMDKKEKAQRRVLSQIGGFIRSDSRRSIRKRKRVSRSGESPSGHVGTLKRGIFFQYSRSTSSVIIGPVKIAVSGPSGQPRALEEGGRSTTSTGTRQGHKKKVTKNIFIGARPFMGPAKDKALPMLPQMWRDSVK